MNMENKEKQNRNQVLITIVIVVVFILILIGIFSPKTPDELNNLPATNNTTNNITQQPQVTPTVDINLKSKCATDGKNFVNNYEISNNQAIGNYRPVWGDPQYHFDSKSNTCLVYIWYTREINEVSTGDMFSSDYSQTIYSNVYNFVFDIYSNQVVLQSVMDRKTPWKGSNVDTVSNYPSYQDIPNLDSNAFFGQLKVLMNE